MLRGITPLALDAKGRLSIPARYRDRLLTLCEGELVVTIDRDRCLLIYPLPRWEEVEQKLMQLSSTNPKTQSLKRLLLGHAEECEMDAQGRISLSKTLREYAQLSKQVVLVGQGNKFELWDEALWEARREEWIEQWKDDGAMPQELEHLSF